MNFSKLAQDLSGLLFYFSFAIGDLLIYLLLYSVLNKIPNQTIKAIIIGVITPFFSYYFLENFMIFLNYFLVFIGVFKDSVGILILVFLAGGKPLSILLGLAVMVFLLNKDRA
ncbi:MAG: hypothetical protein ACRC2R_22675 [Xenococcaceae cyanobacterium]